MSTLNEIIRKSLDDRVTDDMDMESLKETSQLLDQLNKTVKNRIAELKLPEPDDPEYIEIIIDGVRDRIKRDIEYLNISCNHFDRLPDAIYQLKKLKKLFLYNNNFTVEEKKRIRRQFSQKIQIFF